MWYTVFTLLYFYHIYALLEIILHRIAIIPNKVVWPFFVNTDFHLQFLSDVSVCVCVVQCLLLCSISILDTTRALTGRQLDTYCKCNGVDMASSCFGCIIVSWLCAQIGLSLGNISKPVGERPWYRVISNPAILSSSLLESFYTNLDRACSLSTVISSFTSKPLTRIVTMTLYIQKFYFLFIKVIETYIKLDQTLIHVHLYKK